MAAKLITRRPHYDRARLARFSLFKDSLKSTEILWHCVSVGEVSVVAPLIKAIKRQQPGLTFTITTTTPTGAAQVKRLLGDTVQHCYLPYDHYVLMSRLFKRIQPKLLLVTEVEIWPSLLNVCRVKGIPSALINGRMTERSAQKYQKLGRFFSETVSQFAMIAAQSEASRQSFITLGSEPETTLNLGNVKFEINATNKKDPKVELLANFCETHARTFMVAGSTHAPEEQLSLTLHERLKTQHSVLTCIVPRHPQRFDEVANLIEKSGLSYWRYSSDMAIPADCDIVLIDAMGIMHTLFDITDIAFVGGSFAERGGHNALEPALFSVPVVMGPSQYNNPQITAELEAAGGLVTVSSSDALVLQIERWLVDPEQRQQAGIAGHQVIQANKGALDKNCQIIQSLLALKQD